MVVADGLLVNRSLKWLALPALWALLSFAPRLAAQLPIDRATPLALVAALFNLALAGALIFLALVTGRWLWDRLGLNDVPALTRSALSIALGFGLLSYATFALALVRLLYAPVVAALALGLVALLRQSTRAVCDDIRIALLATRQFAATSTGLPRWVACFGALAVLTTSIVALMPPFTYDALWYHLAVPQIFVQQHRFVVLPQLGQADFPLGVEMLYADCLLFGAASSPALLHLAFAFLTSLAVWAFASRWADRRIAWVAAAAFFSASEVERWAMAANIDLGLTLFQFLSLLCLEEWFRKRSLRWLALGGAMAGLAIAAKYTGAIGVAILALLIVAADGWRLRGLGPNLARAALLVAIAVAVASPWYVKNAVTLHNPIYPLASQQPTDPAFPLPGVAAPPAAQSAPAPWSILTLPVRLLEGDPTIAIAGRNWRDYLLLPLNVYRYGDLESHTTPSVFFLLAPLALFFVRDPVIRRLLLIATALILEWAVGPQELRYLLPAFPVLALLSGYSLVRLVAALRSAFLVRTALLLIVVAVLAVMLITNVEADVAVNPLPVLAGQESAQAFLERSATDYGAFAYLNATVSPGEQVLVVGERRRYYARVPLIYDDTRTIAGRVFSDAVSPQQAAQLLRNAGIAYVLWYTPDLTWLGQFHPGQVAELQHALGRMEGRYLQQVYAMGGGHVYRLVGPETSR